MGETGSVTPTPPHDGSTLGIRARTLLEAITAISSDLDLASILTRIVEAATSLTGARYGALGVLGPDGTLVEFITTGMDDRTRRMIGDLPLGRGILGVLIDNPEALRLVDLSAHPTSVGFPPNHPPMTTFLGMPVRIRGTVWGNLYLTEKMEGPFTAADEEMLEALARTAGFVIGNARTYELSERRRQWLEATAEISESLQPPVDFAAGLELIVERARSVSRTCAVAIWSPQGPEHDTIAYDPARPEAEAEVAHTLQQLRDTFASSDSGPIRTTHVQGSPAVVVPIRTHLAEVQALVAVGALGDPPLDIEERELLGAFTDQAALTLDRAQALVDRQEMALISDRERIARDLHDIVIQRLFATGLQLQGIAALSGEDRVAERLDDAVGDLDQTIKSIRGTIFELQERRSGSLRAQIRTLVREYAPVLGFTPTVRTSGPVDSVVPEELAAQVLAVLREAVSNIARHALADRAEVDLAVDDRVLQLSVTDDGVGIPGDVQESGLRNARRRAADFGGVLDVRAQTPRGTRLVWRVPLS